MSFTSTFNDKKVEAVLLDLKGESDFIKNQCLFAGASELAHDAVFEEPLPPIEWGSLRGSVGIAIRGEVLQSPEKAASGQVGEPVQPISPNAVSVSFNVIYASYLEENSDWSPRQHPGVDISGIGSGFLSEKMEKNEDSYLEAMKERLSELI